MISIREIAGWILVVAALFVLNIAYTYLNNRQAIEAGLVTGAAMMIFRGGIHLVKVATAARIALRVNSRQAEKAT